MKRTRRSVSILLALALVFALGATALADSVGTDISGHAEQTALRAFIDKGYILGYGDGSVRPDSSITRAEFAALVNRVAGYRVKGDLSAFTDVSESDWYYNDLAVAYGAGYLIGKSASSMDPTGTVTAGEVDTVIARLSGSETVSSDAAVLTRAQIVARLYAALGSIEGKGKPTGTVYVLMNIPYDAFYGAEGVSKTSDGSLNINFDAISSATNKVGNAGKAGGGYHSAATVSVAEDGAVTAIGGENGAHMEGVTWPVKADAAVLDALGGIEVTDSREVTVGTMGRGQTSATELTGAATLMEAPAYSYYYLSSTPAQYMELTVVDGKPSFSANVGSATTLDKIDVEISYGTNWGDIQFELSAAEETADKQINAMVLTAEDGTTGGMIHLYNIWAYNSLGWYVSDLQGLDGKTITNIRYYCNDQAGNYYVYDYPVSLAISAVYTGEITAAFADAGTITVSGLPEDAANPMAKVYYTSGGRGATYEYLTPLAVDPADDDIDPITVAVVDGKIAVAPGSVTNKAGTTESFGTPEEGKTYTIELSSDNYIFHTASALYGSAPQSEGSGSGHGSGGGNH